MRRLFILISLLSYGWVAMAQMTSERRVYYLDVTGSMETNGIWDEVRGNLKSAIDKIEDETTEIIVIPFTDNRHGLGRVWQERATAQGKVRLKNEIDKVQTESKCYTNLYLPLNDFCNKRIDKNKITYMFLMTDGCDKEAEMHFRALLDDWSRKTSQSPTYGFYVMLHKNANDSAVERKIETQKYLWAVNTADVNINLIRIESEAVFNVRNDDYIDIPIMGKAGGCKIDARLKENAYYELKSYEQKDSKLRVYLEPKENCTLPIECNVELMTTPPAKKDEFTFLVTDKINITCLDKKENSLKITIE